MLATYFVVYYVPFIEYQISNYTQNTRNTLNFEFKLEPNNRSSIRTLQFPIILNISTQKTRTIRQTFTRCLSRKRSVATRRAAGCVSGDRRFLAEYASSRGQPDVFVHPSHTYTYYIYLMLHKKRRLASSSCRSAKAFAEPRRAKVAPIDTPDIHLSTLVNDLNIL